MQAVRCDLAALLLGEAAMSAEVIELHPGMKRLPPVPQSVRERAKDRAGDAHDALTNALAKFPIKIVRQKTMARHERNAFELGVEYGRRGGSIR
jgi:hypothetical protein